MKYIKSILSALLALVMIVALAACGSENQTHGTSYGTGSKTGNTAGQSGEIESAADNSPDNMSAPSESKALVVYFSRTGEQYVVGVIDKGNTAIVAEMIAQKTGADLWEVLPADDHYPMKYNELTDVAKKEQKDNARPEYRGTAPDLSQYDTVFIGAPVWWGDWPMIMYTFFEQNRDSLAGKTLIPFSTHEGSGLAGFDRKLSSAVPGGAVKKGLAIRGSDAQNGQKRVSENIDDWLKNLGY